MDYGYILKIWDIRVPTCIANLLYNVCLIMIDSFRLKIDSLRPQINSQRPKIDSLKAKIDS